MAAALEGFKATQRCTQLRGPPATCLTVRIRSLANSAPMVPEQPAPPSSTASGPRALTGPSPASTRELRIPIRRLIVALVIAGLSDVVCALFILAPPIVLAVDVLTAGLLFVVLGWHWLLLPGLVMEAIPGLGVIPFWVLVVIAIAFLGTARPKLHLPGEPTEKGKSPRP